MSNRGAAARKGRAQGTWLAQRAPPSAASPNGLLPLPDLGLLKLSSPGRKRIIQSKGLVTTMLTSTQFLYTKVVASEEKEFPEGFVKVLEDLRARPGAGLHEPKQLCGRCQRCWGCCKSCFSLLARSLSTAAAAPQHPRLATLKEEPQTVPYVRTKILGEPGLSPINMGTQERIKAESKGLRQPNPRLPSAGAHLAPGGESEEIQEPEYGSWCPPQTRNPARAGGEAQAEKSSATSPAAACCCPAPGARVLSLIMGTHEWLPFSRGGLVGGGEAVGAGDLERVRQWRTPLRGCPRFGEDGRQGYPLRCPELGEGALDFHKLNPCS
ncbi:Transcription factor jun-D [Sciurus carolinensis]|uniref:Transcription factor jun-D n=1 Tax=Sciurus carolinensis TaxID=30640 RepID=A0AA41SUY7_SCICA|nr:Transcription factor jun-D [Sciurus carolinensis]